MPPQPATLTPEQLRRSLRSCMYELHQAISDPVRDKGSAALRALCQEATLKIGKPCSAICKHRHRLIVCSAKIFKKLHPDISSYPDTLAGRQGYFYGLLALSDLPTPMTLVMQTMLDTDLDNAFNSARDEHTDHKLRSAVSTISEPLGDAMKQAIAGGLPAGRFIPPLKTTLSEFWGLPHRTKWLHHRCTQEDVDLLSKQCLLGLQFIFYRVYQQVSAMAKPLPNQWHRVLDTLAKSPLIIETDPPLLEGWQAVKALMKAFNDILGSRDDLLHKLDNEVDGIHRQIWEAETSQHFPPEFVKRCMRQIDAIAPLFKALFPSDLPVSRTTQPITSPPDPVLGREGYFFGALRHAGWDRGITIAMLIMFEGLVTGPGESSSGYSSHDTTKDDPQGDFSAISDALDKAVLKVFAKGVHAHSFFTSAAGALEALRTMQDRRYHAYDHDRHSSNQGPLNLAHARRSTQRLAQIHAAQKLALRVLERFDAFDGAEHEILDWVKTVRLLLHRLGHNAPHLHSWTWDWTLTEKIEGYFREFPSATFDFKPVGHAQW